MLNGLPPIYPSLEAYDEVYFITDKTTEGQGLAEVSYICRPSYKHQTPAGKSCDFIIS